LTTEEKILNAAKKVFLEKGFDRCTTRDIANEAGENVALVNYYFRSKAALFEKIFQDAIDEMMLSMINIFKSDIPLKEKISIFIDREYSFISTFPGLPNFVLSELNRVDGCRASNKSVFEKVLESGIFDQIQKAQDSGEMISIDLFGITTLLLSNCHFPFIAKNLLGSLMSMEEDEYLTKAIEHKEHAKNMIINYLFPNQNHE
jgi:TetR/AcrR family transcriptional regulator